MSRARAVEPEAALPELDRVEDAPHPRETARLFGQERAEAGFLDAWRGGRLHHAWLLRGPRGVGKATLAYRIARAVLAADAPPQSLDLDPEHPVSRRVRAGTEPRLYALTRRWNAKTKRAAEVISAEQARAMERDFFRLSAADGGWRVAIVDSADELQRPHAANALLKIVEEPPARSLILLVSSAPGRLLPTIRSRCRTLDCAPLGTEALARAVEAAGAPADRPEIIAALSGGSPGEALRMIAEDAPGLYARILSLLAEAPGIDRARLFAFAGEASGREAAGRYELIARLTVLALRRLARAAAGGGAAEAPGEAETAARLAPDLPAARLWAETAAELEARAARARLVNLDPARTILDIWLAVDEAARRAARVARAGA